MKTYTYLTNRIEEYGSAHLILLDPDKIEGKKLEKFVTACCGAGVDAFLYGGSLVMGAGMDEKIQAIKKVSKIPVIIFPGSVNQVTPHADAVLFLSLISGRNPEHLIGKHVIAAPLIHRIGIEPIPTGYILVESGQRTTAEYMSGSQPIPRNKPEIAVATALAGQYLGMKAVYLEAGSGAEKPVPAEMVKAVSSYIDIPLIVGGGIRDAGTARELVSAGAKLIVTGNFFEDESEWGKLEEFVAAVHWKKEYKNGH